MASRLAGAASAYLRSAEQQPVDWHPWGAEAFARARSEHKPILLDIGAVWCHWCHVMDGESYEDPTIAELLNRDWICIKVDRDERPDVDARYQRAVQLISGQGGWPLTAFLTPDGDVFYGGTYFPPAGTSGRPGFATVLQQLAHVFREQADTVTEQVAQVRKSLEEMGSDDAGTDFEPAVLRDAADGMARAFDFRYGGFGTQPKFPHPTACDFLLSQWIDARLPWAREMVDRTLLAMARGGVYDQVGGGFHRYSVDARWVVPHFEKMSYDNSELLRAYVHAATSLPALHVRDAGTVNQVELESEYRRVIEGLVGWVMEVLSDPAGGYFASQDADVGLHDDGDYFTWTPDEVRTVVSEAEYAALARRFDIDDHGEMHHNPKKNVLWIRDEISTIAAAIDAPSEEVQRLLGAGLTKLRAARDARETPIVDTTLYVSWNAMMASAMFAAGAYLDRSDIDAHGLRSLERVVEGAREATGLQHAVGSDVPGMLDDYVQLSRAALDAFEITNEASWHDLAVQLMDRVWADFRADDGCLLDRPPGDAHGLLDHPIKPLEDAPTPSATGVAATTLGRLAEITGDSVWRERLEALVTSVGGALSHLGLHGASLLLGASWHVHTAAHIVVVFEDNSAGRALARAARLAYHPRKIVRLVAPDADAGTLPAPVRAMFTGDCPRAYVCVGPQCAPPVSEPRDLLLTVEQS